MNDINKQLERDLYYLRIAKTISLRSKCMSRKIGAVLVKNDSIISGGFNGPAKGVKHCDERDVNFYNKLIGKPETIEGEGRLFSQCPRRGYGFKSGEGLHLCLDGSTRIKLLKGISISLEEWFKNGNEEWVYSIDTKEKQIVPALAKPPIKIINKKEGLIKITLDNNKEIICSSDHKFMLRNGKYKKAKNLKENDSLMALYYHYQDKYECISMVKNRWYNKSEDLYGTFSTPTEELVYRYISGFRDKLNKNLVIHHKDGNYTNNSPNNLILLTRKEHSKIHQPHSLTKEKCIKGGLNCLEKRKQDPIKFFKECSLGGKKSMESNWKKNVFRDRMLPICRDNFTKGRLKSNKDTKAIRNRAISKVLISLNHLLHVYPTLDSSNYSLVRTQNTVATRLGEKGLNPPKEETILKYFDSVEEALNEAGKINHKIIKIEFLNETRDLYDIEVPYFHNFLIDLGDNSGIISHNCQAGHAERNALLQAARNGISTLDTTLYAFCPLPCTPCMIEIINSGVSRLVCLKGKKYDLYSEVLLMESEIKFKEYEENEIF